MENYIVSARKYRPDTFSTVVGQPSITSTLKNAIRSNHLAHAYLFCGPRGVGKTTSARIFAKTINCLSPVADNEPCNQCESCLSFTENRSYNIHELDAASNNSVDDIRSLVEKVRIPPQIGKYSVYIIDEVHMLSQSAFNAFLKTLEEPPAHAIFILATTEKHKILPTILSRCQIYDFNRITISDIEKHLREISQKENVNAEPEALNIIAQKADGAMRDALSIFDQIVSFCGANITYKDTIANLNVLDYDYYFKLTDCFHKGDISGTLMIFSEILDKGFNAHHFVMGLGQHFRDLLVCKDAITVQLLEVGGEIRERYKKQAAACSVNFLIGALQITTECDIQYKSSSNQRFLVELTLVRIDQLEELLKKKTIDEAISTLSLLPIFSGIDSAKSVSYSNIVNSEKVIVTQKPVGTGYTNERPLMRITGRNSFSTPSILDALKDQPKTDETGRIAEVDANKYSKGVTAHPFSQQELIAAWKTFVEKIDAPLLKSALNAREPGLTDYWQIEYELDTELQFNRITLELKPKLLGFLRRFFENEAIEILFTVSSGDSYQYNIPYTDTEKWSLLVEKYPALAALKSKFGLDFEHF